MQGAAIFSNNSNLECGDFSSNSNAECGDFSSNSNAECGDYCYFDYYLVIPITPGTPF